MLGELAMEVGLDPVALRKELAAGRYAGVREAAHEEARGLGITGVPTYVFAGGARVVGAQPLDHFRRLLESMVGSEGRYRSSWPRSRRATRSPRRIVCPGERHRV